MDESSHPLGLKFYNLCITILTRLEDYTRRRTDEVAGHVHRLERLSQVCDGILIQYSMKYS
ncbi:hypothetical protein AVEN_196070-1, partial [Araneus ventricosus]